METSLQEVESVLEKADSLLDLKKRIRIQAKAASLISYQDTNRARAIYVKLWDSINAKTDDGSLEEEDAKIDLLEFLYPVDNKLANELISNDKRSRPKGDSVFDRLSGVNAEARRLAFLSYRLAEDDVVLAAAVLELGLAENTAPLVPTILNRIREKNLKLANAIVSRALDNLDNQSPTLALGGLGTMMIYVFPANPRFSHTTEGLQSDDRLREKFAMIGYSTLRRSLAEDPAELSKSEGYTRKSIEFRAVGQALLAGTLAVLAPKYMPDRFPEVNVIAIGLRSGVPKQLQGLMDFQISAVRATLQKSEDSEVSDVEIAASIARGDFVGAQLLIDKLVALDKRNVWTDNLLRAMAKASLKKGELVDALNHVRKMTNAMQSIGLLIEISEKAHKQKDEALSVLVLQEAQRTTSNAKDGVKARTLFSLVSETAYFMPGEARGMLHKSVDFLNGLSAIKEVSDQRTDYHGPNFWNDPDNFLRSTAFAKAFAVLGKVQMNETLLTAYRLKDNSLQMMARLATIEAPLREKKPKR